MQTTEQKFGSPVEKPKFDGELLSGIPSGLGTVFRGVLEDNNDGK
jgi:hypothetical protein